MYIFVRQDLSHPQQIVQASHATHEAGVRFGATELPTHFVLVGVEDQQKLLEIAEYLMFHQIEHQTFHEPDDNIGYTAIATIPLVGNQRKPMRKFQLLKENNNAS